MRRTGMLTDYDSEDLARLIGMALGRRNTMALMREMKRFFEARELENVQ